MYIACKYDYISSYLASIFIGKGLDNRHFRIGQYCDGYMIKKHHGISCVVLHQEVMIYKVNEIVSYYILFLCL